MTIGILFFLSHDF